MTRLPFWLRAPARLLLVAAFAALPAFLAACASSSGPPREVVRDGSRPPGQQVITREDLYEMDGGTAYDAIQRMRPNWLRGETMSFGGVAPPVLVVDDQKMEISLLRSYRVEQIEWIRYVEPRDATMRYGTGFTGGAIEIRLRGN